MSQNAEPSFDRDGYPSEETLEVVENWDPTEPIGLFDYIERAWHSTGLIRRTNDYCIDLVTGGWSGNEALVAALRQNLAWAVCWQSSHRGGLHCFVIPEGFHWAG